MTPLHAGQSKSEVRQAGSKHCGLTYTFNMRDVIRQNKRWFFAALAAGIFLRLLFVLKYGLVNGDGLVYADIAKNWMMHGVYGITNDDFAKATMIRLPGYPGFLAVVFAIFGMDNFTAVKIIQVVVDLLNCFAVAKLAQEIFQNARATVAAFVIAALCPFTANYTARPLTETFEIFFTTLAILFAIQASRAMDAGDSNWRKWALCGMALASAVLMRPDGGILLAVMGGWMGWLLLQARSTPNPWPRMKQIFAAGILVASITFAPLVPWTIRNWNEFHMFQPLSQRYAIDPGTYEPIGWYRWTRTWVVDVSSSEEILWDFGDDTVGEEIDPTKLPARACDSQEELNETYAAFAAYNQTKHITPEVDQRFAVLAEQRIQRHPLRYYVGLPLMRGVTMWLRPRTETMGIDTNWWVFDNKGESVFAILYAVLNFALVASGVIGALKYRNFTGWGMMVAFVLVRSLYLTSIESPEPRYVLECFPIVMLFAAGLFQSNQLIEIEKI
jgi:hypothetical protein